MLKASQQCWRVKLLWYFLNWLKPFNSYKQFYSYKDKEDNTHFQRECNYSNMHMSIIMEALFSFLIFVPFCFSLTISFFSSKCNQKFTMPRTIVQLQLLMAFQKMMNFNLRLKCWIFLKPRLVSLNDCLSNVKALLANSLLIYFSNFIYRTYDFRNSTQYFVTKRDIVNISDDSVSRIAGHLTWLLSWHIFITQIILCLPFFFSGNTCP